MLTRKFFILLVVILSFIFTGMNAVVMAAEEDLVQHEDPEAVTTYYDGIAILGYYTQLMDHVLQGAYEQAGTLRDKEPFANVPEDLSESLGDFGDTSVKMSGLIARIESEIEQMKQLVSQFRFEERVVIEEETQKKLVEARLDLAPLEEAVITVGKEFGINSENDNDSLGDAHIELYRKIDQLADLLEFFTELIKGIPTTPQAELLETEITLVVAPEDAFVGDWILVEGELCSGGTGLDGRQVVILFNGIPHTKMESDSNGKFESLLHLPYQYESKTITVEALYYPQDADIGTYLGSISIPVTVQLMSYTASLQLETAGKAYPGLDIVLNGQFNYGSSPVLPMRTVEIYLDGKLILTSDMQQSFEQKISLDPEMTVGEHRLLFVALSHERYAPSSSEIVLDVAKAMPIVEFKSSRLVFMPFDLKIKGRVYSELGPVEDARVEIDFGSCKVQAMTSAGGIFNCTLTTGFNVSLVGSEELTVNVYPEAPWLSSGSDARKIITVNPIVIMLMFAMLVAVMVVWLRRFGKRRQSHRNMMIAASRIQDVTKVGPASGKSGNSRSHDGAEIKEEREFILRIYSKLIVSLQAVTGVVLKPQTTFREFVNQVGPKLGLASDYLEQLNRIVERVLYSKEVPADSEVERSKMLDKLVKDQIGHERQ